MILVVFAYILASWIRIDLLGGVSDNIAALNGNSVFLSFVYTIVVFITLSLANFYNTNRTRRLRWKVKTIFITVTFAALLASAVLFVFKLVDFSRGVLVLFYVFVLGFLTGEYTVMRLILKRIRMQGYNLKYFLVIGTGKIARQFAEDVKTDGSLGIEIVGFIGKEQPCPGNYLGDFDALENQLALSDVQDAVIALDPDEYGRVPEMIAACETNGVKYYVIPLYNSIMPAHPVIEVVGESKLIDMRASRLDEVAWRWVKRLFDIAASGIGMIVLSPLFLIIAIGVKLSSPGPVIFRQMRIGYHKREFEMLKFRSMKVNDAEDTAWSKPEDDRRTGFGSLLRKTSLDELPQLWNVFKGDMSLVGPRPELPYYVEKFKEEIPLYMVKHQVKPGITGWAQVNGYRGDTSIRKRIELDLWYIDNWSMWLDIQIILKTIFGGMINDESM